MRCKGLKIKKMITGGKENRMMPEEARQKRLDNQLELLSLSSKSQHIIAKWPFPAVIRSEGSNRYN